MGPTAQQVANGADAALVDKVRAIRNVIDYTRLDEKETVDGFAAALEGYKSQPTVAVCSWPRFLSVMKSVNARNCVVLNFPTGKGNVDSIVAEAKELAKAGVNEVDVVIDYELFMKGDEQTARNATLSFLRSVRAAVPPPITLKVIIESGMLQESGAICRATRCAIEGGANFVKTSTGKVAVGATLEHAKIILQTIKDCCKGDGNSLPTVGFKASGGVRTVEQAVQFLDLVTDMMGQQYATNPMTFRIGASSLLGAVDDFLVAHTHKK